MKISKVALDMFTRINNCANGNPRYLIHFINVDSDYNTASYIVKMAGESGRKITNKDFGGGILVSSFNLQDTCDRINASILKNIFDYDIYTSYLLNCFVADYDEYDFNIGSDSISQISAIVSAEMYTGKTYEDHMRGIPGYFANDISDHDIIRWAKRSKVLRKNASEKTIEYYLQNVHWQSLGLALERIVKTGKGLA